MRDKHYDTDLTDEQFALIEPFLPKTKATGRPHANFRDVVDGILYLVRTGCQWRLLPHEFPPWSTVHTWYRKWRLDGTWDRILESLRRQVRFLEDRHPLPRVSALDSQSVKTTEMGGVRGFDAAKKIKGRKRHIWVDSMGLLLAVLVTAGDVTDAKAAEDVLGSVLWTTQPRLETVYVDSAYATHRLKEMLQEAPFRLHVVRRNPEQKGWQSLPKRWVVERTFAWLGRARRLSKDYERLTQSSEAMVKIRMIDLMLHRLAPEERTWTQRFRYAA
jgi:putative transposase